MAPPSRGLETESLPLSTGLYQLGRAMIEDSASVLNCPPSDVKHFSGIILFNCANLRIFLRATNLQICRRPPSASAPPAAQPPLRARRLALLACCRRPAAIGFGTQKKKARAKGRGQV